MGIPAKRISKTPFRLRAMIGENRCGPTESSFLTIRLNGSPRIFRRIYRLFVCELAVGYYGVRIPFTMKAYQKLILQVARASRWVRWPRFLLANSHMVSKSIIRTDATHSGGKPFRSLRRRRRRRIKKLEAVVYGLVKAEGK